MRDFLDTWGILVAKMFDVGVFFLDLHGRLTQIATSYGTFPRRPKPILSEDQEGSK